MPTTRRERSGPLSIVTRHWELKLLSLLVACVVWVFVVGGARSRMTLAAPVEYVGLGPDTVLVSDTRERVDVELEVAGWAAGRVTPDTLRVRVNLAGLREGENVVAVSPAEVQAPSGVTVTRITPPRLRVAVARAAERALHVVPQIRGTPAPGFVTVRAAAVPSLVQVRGPRSTIEGRATVDTTPVDVSGRRADVVQAVGLLLPEFVYAVRGGSVEVTVEIRPDDRTPKPAPAGRR